MQAYNTENICKNESLLFSKKCRHFETFNTIKNEDLSKEIVQQSNQR
jgi:hypothetical protein